MVSNTLIFLAVLCREQPPPRGCVLKRVYHVVKRFNPLAAASARLCVETMYATDKIRKGSSSRLRAAVC